MPQRAEVVLSDEEREVLERWARRPKSSQALALRCRIVLAAANGELSKDIAERLGCNASTVGKWRGRFAAQRLDGLHAGDPDRHLHGVAGGRLRRLLQLRPVHA